MDEVEAAPRASGFVQAAHIPHAHASAITGVKFSPSGRALASCSSDRLVKLWDGLSGAPLATLEGHLQGVSDVAWDPDGIFLASASDDTTIRIWDVATVRSAVLLRAPCRPPFWLPAPPP